MFTIKKGDTKKSLYAELSNQKGPVDLTECKVYLRIGSLPLNNDGLCEIKDAAAGLVWYVFEQGETDQPGFYKGEFEVHYPDFRKETFPNDGYIDINIKKDLR